MLLAGLMVIPAHLQGKECSPTAATPGHQGIDGVWKGQCSFPAVRPDCRAAPGRRQALPPPHLPRTLGDFRKDSAEMPCSMHRHPGDQPVDPDIPGKPPEPADTPPHGMRAAQAVGGWGKAMLA